MSGESLASRSTRAGLVAALMSVIAGVTMLVAPGAHAAPAGRVDAGVPLSSAVYGTGCTYPVTVPVDSSGWVEFWEVKPGLPARFIGRDLPSGALASVTWVPRRIGDKYLYAVQNGKASQPTLVKVRQGYGSNGTCLAF
ncbi:hypothetical protein RD149_16680 [Gordonia westfalica]|uniref:Uncharacterized protein n=2 Tax=Gordonia westfalica TaxID=158898 RepID=A0A1H2K672_9ACTN|nr:hypothetical protein [Gordonia westfalica]MDS1115393.1 hypothetical protein [Gordonia westfalica]SDU64063.1 hypothetical protein SAMN04488548_1342886 [Gordonia westfalica]